MDISGEVYFNASCEIEASFDRCMHKRLFFKSHHARTLSPQPKLPWGFEGIIGAILFRQCPDMSQHPQMDAMNDRV